MRYTVLAVGKVKPPYADDVAHYERLLRKQARVDVIEVADDDAIARRIPERAYVSLLDDRGEAYDSEAFARWLEQRRQAGLDVCFVLGGAYGIELGRSDHPFRTNDSVELADFAEQVAVVLASLGAARRLPGRR